MKKLLLSVVISTTFITGAYAMYGYHSEPYGEGRTSGSAAAGSTSGRSYGYHSEPGR